MVNVMDVDKTENQKATNDAYRKGYERIWGKKDDKETTTKEKKPDS
tara:strand:- start:1655 stop:1792 length:138 start_codon:yes stop_codon:yes gene_type:complete